MVYYIKRFSEGSDKTSSMETIGKVGLGIGAGAGLLSGGYYLAQNHGIKKLREGQSFTQSQGMKVINDSSKKMSFKDIENLRQSSLKSISKNTTLPSCEVGRQVSEVNRTAGVLKNSKLKRMTGRAALVAGGIGALAYGASKLSKKD